MKAKRKVNFPKQKIESKNNPNIFRRLALFVLAVGIMSFNLLVKVEVKAGNNSEAITVENLLKAHNEYRKDLGLNELKLNNLLNISSHKKGDAMIESQCWSHYCPDGKSPWKFLEEANYDYVYAGENLAEGYHTIDSVMQAWINSKSHRENIVKEEFNEVGFSILNADYLNNSNNILVVVHFGSTAIGPAVNSAQNPQLEVTSPKDNEKISSDSIEVSGIANGLDTVRVFNNNTLQGEASISGGIFNYKISELEKGENVIWADGSNSQVNLDSNKVTVHNELLATQISEENFVITSEQKNIINFIVVIILALVFFIDMILVSRSTALNVNKSFSHYHLALVGLVALIILVGGFAGQIENGISV